MFFKKALGPLLIKFSSRPLAPEAIVAGCGRNRKLVEKRELAAWIFCALAAMALALPLCLWRHQSPESDFNRLLKAISSRADSEFKQSRFRPAADPLQTSLALPLELAPAGPARAEMLAALSPDIDLLKKLAEPVGAPPVFNQAAGRYERLIEETARQYQVSPLLVKAVIQTESGFNPLAVSKRGAVGLMQVMPATALDMGVSNPQDPVNNIVAGVRYLKTLLVQFNDDERLAVAAYNCGPENVKRWGGTPPYGETKVFVRRVMRYYNYHLS